MFYDPASVHNEKEKSSYGELSQKVQTLLVAGKNKAAMKTFLKGIGMPSIFVFLLPLFPGWKTMVALAPTLACDIARTKDLPLVERASYVDAPILEAVGEKSPVSIQSAAEQND